MKGRPPTNSVELHNAYKEEIHHRVEAIANGAPQDYAAYQKLVGVISGLRLAEQMLQDLLNRDEHDDGYEPP